MGFFTNLFAPTTKQQKAVKAARRIAKWQGRIEKDAAIIRDANGTKGILSGPRRPAGQSRSNGRNPYFNNRGR